jgi:hypothetical protein
VRRWRRGTPGSPPLLVEELYDLEQGASGSPDWNETNNLLAAAAQPLAAEAQSALGMLRNKLDSLYPKLVQ